MKDIVNNLKEMKRAIKLQKDRPRHCCDIKEAQGKSRSPSVHSTSQPAAISDQNMVKWFRFPFHMQPITNSRTAENIQGKRYYGMEDDRIEKNNQRTLWFFKDRQLLSKLLNFKL